MTDIEIVKSKLDIVEVIGSYVSELKRSGANYKANCPFHNEKTPSFMVNPSLQIFKCFGCGKAGDVIKFIEEIERVDFLDALNLAAERAGVELSKVPTKNDKLENEKQRLIEANTLTAKFYNYILTKHQLGKEGKSYAQKRGIDNAMIEKFQVGFAPNARANLKKFLLARNFTEKELVKWGLLVERGKVTIDKFRNRLLQPIFNLRGEVVGFSGRYIGTNKEAPKYLNSPETLVYKKNELLYGFFQGKEAIRKQNFVILVEGNIDILSSNRIGIQNIVAPLGTSFTLNQAKLVKRFCEEIYFCFDTDEAGIKALIRGLEIVETVGLKHRVINLGSYQDADELIMQAPEMWEKLIDKSENTLEYLTTLLAKDLDLESADGKSKFNYRIVPVLKVVKDEVLLSHYIKKVAQMLEVPAHILTAKLGRGASKLLDPGVAQSTPIVVEELPSSKLEVYFLSLLLQTNKLNNFDDLTVDYFQDPQAKEIYTHLAAAGDAADFGKIAEVLDAKTRHIFEEIVLFDISKVKKKDQELEFTYKRILERYLKKEIFKLRKTLSQDGENEMILQQLNKYTSNLKNL